MAEGGSPSTPRESPPKAVIDTSPIVMDQNKECKCVCRIASNPPLFRHRETCLHYTNEYVALKFIIPPKRDIVVYGLHTEMFLCKMNFLCSPQGEATLETAIRESGSAGNNAS